MHTTRTVTESLDHPSGAGFAPAWLAIIISVVSFQQLTLEQIAIDFSRRGFRQRIDHEDARHRNSALGAPVDHLRVGNRRADDESNRYLLDTAIAHCAEGSYFGDSRVLAQNILDDLRGE